MYDSLKLNKLITKYNQYENMPEGRKIQFLSQQLKPKQLISTYRNNIQTIQSSRLPQYAFKKKMKGSNIPNQQNVLIERKKSKNLLANNSKKLTIQSKKNHNKTIKQSKQLNKQKTWLDLKKSNTFNISKIQKKKSDVGTKIKKKNDENLKKNDQNLIKKKKNQNKKQKKKSLSLTPQKSTKKSKSKLSFNYLKQFQKIDRKYQEYKRKITFTNHQLPTQRILRNSLNRTKSFDRFKARTQRSLTEKGNFKKQKILETQSKSKSRRKKLEKSLTKTKKQTNKSQTIIQNNSQIATFRKNHDNKKKKFVTQIKTEYSDEKKQYFDQEYLKKLQIFKTQSFDQKEATNKQKNLAAIKIQAFWRGYRVRKQIKKQFHNNVELNYSLSNNKMLPIIHSYKEQNFSNYLMQKENGYRIGQWDQSTSKHQQKQIQIQNSLQRKNRKKSEQSKTIVNDEHSIDTFSQKSSFYESQLQKIKQQQQQKWNKMIDILKTMKDSTQKNEVLDKLIEESEQNRKNIKNIDIMKKKSRQNSQTQEQQKSKKKQQFQQKRCKYDDKPLQLKKRRKVSKQQIQKINQSYSKQYSSKKLLQQIDLCEYNHQQIENQISRQIMEPSPKQSTTKDLEQIFLGSSIKKINITEYLNETKQNARKQIEIIQKKCIQTIQTQLPNKQDERNFDQKTISKDQQLINKFKNPTIVQQNIETNEKHSQKQYMKRQIIVEQILSLLIYQFLELIKEDNTILHKFITYCNQFSIKISNEPSFYQNQNDNGDSQPIICDNAFILNLNSLFIEYLESNFFNIQTINNNQLDFIRILSFHLEKNPSIFSKCSGMMKIMTQIPNSQLLNNLLINQDTSKQTRNHNHNNLNINLQSKQNSLSILNQSYIIDQILLILNLNIILIIAYLIV